MVGSEVTNVSRGQILKGSRSQPLDSTVKFTVPLTGCVTLSTLLNLCESLGWEGGNDDPF